MKTLVAYCSQHGTTAKCAQKIAAGLGANVTVVDLSQTTPLMEEYAVVVLGGSIHAGQIQKPVKDFCAHNEAALLERPLALFLCCGNADQYELQLEKAFSAPLREHALISVHCGYGYPLERMGFFSRMILRLVAKVTTSDEKIDPKAIDALVQTVQS